jgi:hypothetical protein
VSKISVGQALLILINHKLKLLNKESKKHGDPELIKRSNLELEELKKLYLLGVKDEESRLAFANYLEDPLLLEYEVSADPEVINNDSSRRYFETHLAYETLVDKLDLLSLNGLKHYLQSVKKLAPRKYSGLYDYVLNTKTANFSDKFDKEYGDYLKKIRNAEIYAELPKTARRKLIAIVSAAFVTLVIGDTNPDLLPLNIYEEGFYLEENRGKKTKTGQQTTHTSALGVLKGHMPIAKDDVALMQKTQNFTKPSDQSDYVLGTAWTDDNFSRLVHPFSNSISGTMLLQLRALLKIKEQRISQLSQVSVKEKDNPGLDKYFPFSKEKMETFLTVFIAVLLFNSGGHSLHEFVAPIDLDKIKNAFSDIEGFNTFNLQELFLTNNPVAFDKALEKAISYNNQILKIAGVNQKIKEQKKEFDQGNLKTSVINSNFPTEVQENFMRLIINDVDHAQSCFNLAIQLQNLIVKNQARVSGEFFSYYREGSKRHKILETNLNEVIEQLSLGSLSAAVEKIEMTKEKLKEFKFPLFHSPAIPELNSLIAIQEAMNKFIDTSKQMKIGTDFIEPSSDSKVNNS